MIQHYYTKLNKCQTNHDICDNRENTHTKLKLKNLIQAVARIAKICWLVKNGSE